jgi:hypothetical protein
MTALAQGNGVRRATGSSSTVTATIPWDADRPYQVIAGRVHVMFFPGSLPELEEPYLFTLHVIETDDEAFVVELTLYPPVKEFLRPVPVKFGTASEVHYCETNDCAVLSAPIPTRGGWATLEHFSRYSGWY